MTLNDILVDGEIMAGLCRVPTPSEVSQEIILVSLFAHPALVSATAPAACSSILDFA